MKIIVLAAGEGKRMWPIQTDKCLIPFLGQPLLYHNLKKIKENLDGEFVIIASSRNQDGVESVARNLGLSYKIVIQKNPTGMADALLSAKEELDGEILVVNAEDVLDQSVYQGILKVSADVVVTGLKVKKYFPGGYLRLDGNSSSTSLRNGKVKGIVEKPGKGKEPSDLVKLVVDCFKDGKLLVSYLEKVSSEKDDRYEVALDQMIKDKIDLRFVNYDGAWVPLKYPWHILDTAAYLLSKLKRRISKTAKISDKAIIEGNIVVEDGVKIFEGAIVKGPAFIGKNCIIGNNSFVRESILEKDCVTGFNSDITRSYIGADSWFHTNYVGDSVLEGDFGMGSGAVLANLRLDNRTIRIGKEKIDSSRHKLGLICGFGVRIGVNASTMPGVRIGENSLVGPGVVLKKDLKENQKITIKENSYETRNYEVIPTSYDQFRDKLE
ncbi:NTP transferase domain-containing protein [Patescibacteria group bacterium]|nr:NTP transferase domain-containing protein [Patescibacteria group bacterium]